MTNTPPTATHTGDPAVDDTTPPTDMPPAQQLAELVGHDTARTLIQAGWDAVRAAAFGRPDLVHPGVADYVATVAILGAAPILLAAGRTAAAVDLRELINDLTDPDPCQYDHHGYCQAHCWFETDPRCPHARAQDWLANNAEGDDRG
jgi:hypothetical protein